MKKTKKIILRIIKCAIIGSMLAVGIVTYSFKIEPKRLITREYQLELTTGGENSIRVVQFSDVHLGPNFSLKQLEKLVIKINRLKPDVIAFTGDLMDVPSQFEGRLNISDVLGKLKSTYGNYAVWGNHDHGGGGNRFYADIMVKSGFKVLRNESSIIDLGNGKVLNVIGLDDAMLGNPNVQKAYSGVDEQGATLLLLHQPDLVDEVGHENFDLALAGHSHGGQVVLPVVGPIVTPPLAKKYTKGMYKLGNDHHLYVNSGIGTTRIPIRFWDPSEISVFDLTL
ncbi:metallophosphoesterase [Psychrobacillus glaciei]|uniref:Metallophosphoesterase n=1 Tax=Psychrobacillus glaciei TaxID=2283160 RepID=A0A5J6SQN0_9BACI|nr:metallophosphoesterase [Psychrobacillus glaciei]QFF99972.1 metallophosphoesterase [Psychrobacillus glaciei]